jgi:uncharacterized protein YbdZ (MbtH family)
VSINPFDDNGSFPSWSTAREQHNQWQAFRDVPAAWWLVYGEADRAVCLGDIEQNRTDIQPASLREKSAAGRGVDK